MKLLPISITQAMMGTAVLDITVGVLLLAGIFTYIVALVGALHIAVVLIVSGVTDITVRDLGLFAGMLALTLSSLPAWAEEKLRATHLLPKIK